MKKESIIISLLIILCSWNAKAQYSFDKKDAMKVVPSLEIGIVVTNAVDSRFQNLLNNSVGTDLLSYSNLFFHGGAGVFIPVKYFSVPFLYLEHLTFGINPGVKVGIEPASSREPSWIAGSSIYFTARYGSRTIRSLVALPANYLKLGLGVGFEFLYQNINVGGTGPNIDTGMLEPLAYDDFSVIPSIALEADFSGMTKNTVQLVRLIIQMQTPQARNAATVYNPAQFYKTGEARYGFFALSVNYHLTSQKKK